MTQDHSKTEPALRRSIGPFQVTLYALGSMLGAGIYGLIGKAAGLLGNAIWIAFLVAMVTALLTGLSYAALGARYPRAGGAAYIAQRAFAQPMLSYVVGLAVACAGLTSMATGARVIGENMQSFPLFSQLPVAIGAVMVLALLAALVFRGIVESMWVNVVCTFVEAGGLILVIIVGLRFWGTVDYFETPAPATTSGLSAVPLFLLLQGAVLTFYSFIGFEDTLNVAEECKSPEVTVPVGLISAMILAAVLYMAVAVTAVSVVPWRELAASPAPLAEVITRAAPWFPPWIFVVITVFAVGNTVLINFVTASRLVYGMARDGLLARTLAAIHPARRTPHRAVAALFCGVAALAVLGDISALAAATVLLLLVVFVVINSALVVVKIRSDAAGLFDVPIAVPILGALTACVLLISRVTSEAFEATAIAGGLLGAIVLLYVVTRPKGVPAEP